MNEAKRKTPEDGALYAAQVIRETLLMLTEHDGLSPEQAIAGAHAEIITAMVMGYGGKVTADRCIGVAMRVADIPSELEARLLMSRPAGHA